ncbi:alpha/beta fold hydrolase [Tautonia plasticadhaerens]|nr:alpha/beta hydrolase [Tautonia plasticadhaerens]
MGPAPTFVLKAALLIGGLHSPPDIGPMNFQGWFEEASRGRLEIPEPVADRARRFRYVFVLGLLNERMPGYFDQAEKEFRSLGVPSESIHRIAPSSDATFSENLDAIRDEFLRIADLGPEPLVVVGHSRGACDALAFALLEPGFVSERVSALFLVQGPFGGSGAADYLVGSGRPIDERMPVPARAIARLIRDIESRRLDRGQHGGIVDLTRDAARTFWEEMLEAQAEAIPIVGPRTFYIESSVSPTKHPPFRRPVAKYLETYYGPNDGLVAAGDQFLPELGLRLGMLDVSHTDLTHRFPAARPRPRLRGAFARSIIMAVGGQAGPEPDPTPISPDVPDDDGSIRAARR